MSSPFMLVNSEVVAGASAVEHGGAATMGATAAGTAAPATAILPPGAEEASAAAAAAFMARGAETQAMLAQLVAVRELFAQTMSTNAAAYAAVDGINHATLAL